MKEEALKELTKLYRTYIRAYGINYNRTSTIYYAVREFALDMGVVELREVLSMQNKEDELLEMEQGTFYTP